MNCYLLTAILGVLAIFLTTYGWRKWIIPPPNCPKCKTKMKFDGYERDILPVYKCPACNTETAV